MEKRAQSSLEFMLVFGISFTILIVMGGIFLGYFNTEKKSLDNTYLDKIGNEMIASIEKVYFLGDSNRITIDVKFPEGVHNITIIHRNNFTLTDGTNVSFDVLNISFEAEGEILSNLYDPYEFYIRFNCSMCTHNATTNISYYDSEDFSPGFKKIRFESKGDYVAVDFPKR